MSKSKRTIGHNVAIRYYTGRGWTRGELRLLRLDPATDESRLDQLIDRAVRAAFYKGWSMGIRWESASKRGDNALRNALYNEAANFNRPAKRSRK